MCIAILVEQGKLSFEDNIQKFLPGWPDYGTPIRIKHLLHHTSGVREYLTLVELMGKPEGSGYVYTPTELVKTLSRQKELNFKPGKMFSYSNSGYFLLSEIITRVSGIKASAFAKKYIFSPLGMENTHFHDNPNMIVKNRAYGYSQKKDGGYRLNILRLKVIGDLGVFTTIEDFLKWDCAREPQQRRNSLLCYGIEYRSIWRFKEHKSRGVCGGIPGSIYAVP